MAAATVVDGVAGVFRITESLEVDPAIGAGRRVGGNGEVAADVELQTVDILRLVHIRLVLHLAAGDGEVVRNRQAIESGLGIDGIDGDDVGIGVELVPR